MKKHLFIAFAAAGLLASCSSNDDDFNAPGGNQPGINENDPVEILLGVGAQANVATRGTGSVGATHNEIAANNWAKQIVNVYMFDRFTFKKATADGINAIYDNAVFMTPASGSAGVAHHLDAASGDNYDYETKGYKRSYYPMNGNFSFWAYRVDDANGGRIEQDVTPGSTTYAKTTGEGFTAVQKNGENAYVLNSVLDENLGTESNWTTQTEVVATGYTALYSDGGSNYSRTQDNTYTTRVQNSSSQDVYVATSVGDGDLGTESNWKTLAEAWADYSSNYAPLYEKVTAPVINYTKVTAGAEPTVASSVNEAGQETGTITVDFTIDGTQDVLSASTYLTAADTMALAKNAGLTRDAQTGALVLEGTDLNTYQNYAKSLYSAKTARQNVQPNLLFKHMLTRFTFNAAAMQPNFAQGGDDEIRIKDIKIYSRKNGQLVAKYEAATASKGQDSVIVCNLVVDQTDANPKEGLSLQKRATGATESAYLVALTDGTAGTSFTGIQHEVEGTPTTNWTPMGIAIVDKSEDEWTALGEALLVMPDETEYVMDITIEQTVYGREDVDGNGIDGTQEIKEATIKGLKIEANKVLKGEHATSDGENAGIQKFLAGNSYNVRVQVYGLSKIEVTTTLEPWANGGHVDIDPDNQF